MSDVRLYATPNGGEIDFVAGQAVMADGLETAVLLSLFGGNENDGGGQADDSKQWWGNLGEADPARRYRSETQALLRSLPLVPANLQRLQDAASRDLAWMTDTKLASVVTVKVTIPALNAVKLTVNVVVDGNAHPFTFTQPAHGSH